MHRPSIVEYFGRQDGHNCGYCKGKNSSLTYGMWAHSLTHSDYQDLIDSGWRRSGKYLYKPIMTETCCPMYTIRCKATEFKLSKSQRKTIKKFRNFIIFDRRPESKRISTSSLNDVGSDQAKESHDCDKILESDAQLNYQEFLETKASQNDLQTYFLQSKSTKINALSKDHVSEPSFSNQTENQYSKTGLSRNPRKVLPQKAKDLRRQRAIEKGKEKRLKTQQTEKTLEEVINEPFPENAKHKFEIVTVHAKTNDHLFNKNFDEAWKIYRKYQMQIHGDGEDACKKSQYTRFLCDSSIYQEHRSGTDHGYGSFHQQYIVDGKIVAVGVIDILRNCVSSVYFFYDPDYGFLSLGTLSSLFEIAFVKSLGNVWPEIEYYYMGYYIHTCPKMMYKAKISGSYLLCPETSTWVKFEQCEPLLNQAKYSKLCFDEPPSDIPLCLDKVSILYGHQAMNYEIYQNFRLTPRGSPQNNFEDDDIEIIEYATLVGADVSRRMLLYRS